MTATVITFEINGRAHAVSAERALEPLLDYLRDDSRLTGTKEGCRSGECGACMVLMQTADGWKAVNSCLQALGQAHGQRVVTIEGVGDWVGAPLHPAQDAVINCRAAQCGFCTPGMVMALACAQLAGQPSAGIAADARAALAGNLCRCTGYRPLLEAAEQLRGKVCVPLRQDASGKETTGYRLHGGDVRFFAPEQLDELLALRRANPQARLFAGGTDLMVEWNKGEGRPSRLISTRNVTALREISPESRFLRIGAAVPLQAVFRELLGIYPELAEFVRRIASPAINAVATLAGNLQTASAVGDLIPLMKVLDAKVELSSLNAQRQIAVQDFYGDYRTTRLQSDEVITAVLIPHRQPQQVIFARKVAKRFDQDIATLSLAASLTVIDGVVEQATLCFGGMSATNMRAHHAETSLIGNRLDRDSIEAAGLALPLDYAPISDLRGSSGYRLRVAANLLRKLQLEHAGIEPTSLWQTLNT